MIYLHPPLRGNEKLTAVQKFHYLGASVTGRAARSIQSLEITEANHSIALDVLKEKFDCHRRICMRHLQLMREYAEITKGIQDAVEDLLETVKANLTTLEKLGESITSNAIIIELFSSKLPSSIIRKWQRTLPNKTMSSYTHLMEFLRKRANGNEIRREPTETKRSSYQYSRHRQNLPRGHTFLITNSKLVCPTCQGPHNLRHCMIFKAKSAIQRFELVKGASLCTNSLGRGYSLTQCPASSCHTCGQRNHKRIAQPRQFACIKRSVIERSVIKRSVIERSGIERTTGPLTDEPHLEHGHRVRHIVRDAQPNRRGNLLNQFQRVGNSFLNTNLDHHGPKVPNQSHPPIHDPKRNDSKKR